MNKIIALLILAFAFSQCSKKTMDTATVAAETKNSMNNWRSKAPGSSAARAIEIGDYESFSLPSGLNVIVVENHKLPRVSYQISLINDPIIEGDQAGYSSFAGDLLTKGTKNRTKAQIDNEIDFIGADLSTSGTGVFGSSLKKHSEKLLDVMTDVLFNPSFPKDEFDKLKSQAISGLASAKADPNTIASNVSSVLMYGKNHPYGEIETEKTVNNTTIEKCKEYYNTYFKPNNSYLVIVGDITADEAKAQVNKYFNKWQGGAIPFAEYKSPTPPSQTKVAFANKDGAVQSVIKITYPINLTPGSPDEIPASLMNSILGGGIFLGRLMQNLREDKAYTYGARSSLNSDKLVGSFSATASVRNAVTDSSVHEFIYEMERLVNEPVSEEDLRLAKNSMIGSFARSLESAQTIARFALNTYRYNLPKDYYNTYLSKLEAVTVADVQNAAKKFIRPNNAYIVVVGNKDEVAEKLLPYDKDGKIEYYDAFGEELHYDNVALPDNITANTILDDYFTALGGISKLKTISALSTVAGMSIMGQDAEITTHQKMPDKFSMNMSMGGMSMQEQKLNGNKAMNGGMGQKKVVMAGDPEFNSLKNEAKIFKQLDYSSAAYKLDLKGTEDVDGTKCYKIQVTDPDGEISMEYYSMKDNLLLRTVKTEGEGEQVTTINTNYSDYRDVSGVKLPYTVTVTGVAPFPLEMKVKSYEVNPTLNDTLFTIE